MPPQSQSANRIGLGVAIDDPGGVTLTYLREVRSVLREIKDLGRDTGTGKLPRIQERQQAQAGAAQREVKQFEDTTRRKETIESAHVQRMKRFDQIATQSQEQAQAHLDSLSAKIAANQKRRATDVAEHSVRVASQATHTVSALFAQQTVDAARAQTVATALLRQRAGLPGGPGLPVHPQGPIQIQPFLRGPSAAEQAASRAYLERVHAEATAFHALRPSPSTAVPQGFPVRLTAQQEAEILREKAQARISGRGSGHLTQVPPTLGQPLNILGLQERYGIDESQLGGEFERTQKFRDKARQRYLERQQRKQFEEEFEFEQRATRTPASEAARIAAEIETAAIEKEQREERKRAVNERVNQRAEARRKKERAEAEKELAHKREVQKVEAAIPAPPRKTAEEQGADDLRFEEQRAAAIADRAKRNAVRARERADAAERAKIEAERAGIAETQRKAAESSITGAIRRDAQARIQGPQLSPLDEAKRREVRRLEEKALRDQARSELGLGGGPGGPGGPGGRGGRTPGGPFGTVDILTRITRNILLYQAVSTVTYGLKDYIATAIEAARANSDLALSFNFAVEQAGTTGAQFNQLSKDLLALGQSRRQARGAIIEAARFAENEPEKIEPLVRAVTNIAAARGLGLESVDQLIEQFRRRESKFFKRSLGTTVEELYEAEARKKVGQEDQLNAGLFVGPRSEFNQFNRTQNQRVRDYVAAMSDAEKEQAALNAIIAKGADVAGAAAERQSSLAGRLDALKALWDDNTVAMGEFILQLQPVSDLIAGLGLAFEGLRGSVAENIEGTGPGGIITEADKTLFAQRYARGRLAGIERFVETGRPETYFSDFGGMSFVKARQRADEVAAKQARQAAEQGLLRFYLPGIGRPEGLTPAEREQRIQEGRNRAEDFQQILAQPTTEFAKPAYEKSMERAQDEFWNRVNEREREEAQDLLNRQGATLAKLRETQANIFQVSTTVSGVLAPDNQFVQLLTEQASAAQRMEQQWGHLGAAQVDYFTQLEDERITLQLFRADFESAVKAQQLLSRANREAFERETSPELSGAQQNRVALAQAILSTTQKIPELERERQRVLGVGPILTAQQFLGRQLQGIEDARVAGIGAGAAGGRGVNNVINESILGLLSNVDPEVIRNSPRLRELYRNAIEGQIIEQQARVVDEIKRGQIIEFDRQQLVADVKAQNELRERRTAEIEGEARRGGRALTGSERRMLAQIGAVSDAQLIALTEGRELDDQTFQLRNAALRREAEREVARFTEAEAAVEEGLRIQTGILAAIESIREGLLNGDMSLLVQVENDTQARTDADALKDVSSGLTPRGGFPVRSSQPAPKVPRKD